MGRTPEHGTGDAADVRGSKGHAGGDKSVEYAGLHGAGGVVYRQAVA